MRILCRNCSKTFLSEEFSGISRWISARFVVVSTYHTCIHVRIYWVSKMLNAENYNINVENDGRHDRVLCWITLCREIVWKRKIWSKANIFCGFVDFIFKVMAFLSHLNLFVFFFHFRFCILFAIRCIHNSHFWGCLVLSMGTNKSTCLFDDVNSNLNINCECEWWVFCKRP